MPYCTKERNKALYKQIKTFSGSKFLILKNIPHVLASFLNVHLNSISNLDVLLGGDLKI